MKLISTLLCVIILLIINWKLTLEIYAGLLLVVGVVTYGLLWLAEWYLDRNKRNHDACLRRIAILEKMNDSYPKVD